MDSELSGIADRLIAAYDSASSLTPITASRPDFSVDEAYAPSGHATASTNRCGHTSGNTRYIRPKEQKRRCHSVLSFSHALSRKWSSS